MKKGTSEPLPPTYRIRRHRVTIDNWLCSIGQKRDCFVRKQSCRSGSERNPPKRMERVTRHPCYAIVMPQINVALPLSGFSSSKAGLGTRPTMLSGRPLKLSPVTQGDKCPPTVGMVGELLRAQACDAIQLYSAQFSRQ